ncbi:DUF3800 domain-containing protein [Agrobacterium tumefaciens]|uniref:DUF3800 domain-containing protein n=1 Tax=Agrobacterium tumefaciens TaxID=358 RepID=A0AA44J7V1_AGRTU|nr:DUF3800 domain-containing protein [Agrobacterium tumefaciens]NSL21684.1 DUF3800 domain-containing protein [Agrobacterium tumefaciens]NTC16666.1 DUF3800 domain-containing protein [Agrobacterium tumefaciens]NTC28014.1 DUF3800 domain-containing protein [Agrobacterium tumefaciens]NTC58292.1 DUF3800 domain-containing protein [Agrobacterium tumefaciens]NTC60165.1 DUF3800 domain-containing protein [Agrobacterium tumefaciens]
MATPSPRLISCDEAGFTGPKLLDEDQTIFAYASVDLSAEEGKALVDELRATYKVQSPELKAGLLRKRKNWIDIAEDVAARLEGRAIVMICDKRLNLGGKAYEYIFEPVLADNSALFYRYNLHRFVMNALHRIMYTSGQPVHQIATEFQTFMRTFKPEDAPSLFDGSHQGNQAHIIMNCVLRFAKGYATKIADESTHLQEDESTIGKWTLDLTATALWSLLLTGWGHRHARLDVLCDDSKPLGAMVDAFDGFVDNTEGIPISDGQNPRTLRANLANPIRFGSSSDNPTLQVADVIAGLSVDAIRYRKDAAYAGLNGWLDRHMHIDHTLPDDDWIDAGQLLPRANFAVLQELASRADRGADPLNGMGAVYAAAFKKFKSPASRIRNPLKTLLGKV